MTIPLAYRCDGATLDTGLAECLSDAGDAHGVELTGDVSNGTTYVHCGIGWPVGSVARGDTALTGNGSTWGATAAQNSAVGFDASWLWFMAQNGVQAAYAWHYWPVSPALTQADNFQIDFTYFSGGNDTGRPSWLIVGMFGAADNNDANAMITLIGNYASQYSDTYMSDGTRVASSNINQDLRTVTQRWGRLIHTAANRTWTLSLWSDAYVTQLGSTVTATWTAGKTFSLDKFGIRATPDSFTTDYGGFKCWKPISATNVDFKRYSTASPTAILVKLEPGTGTVDADSAEMPILLNGVIQAESSVLVKVGHSVDNGSNYTEAVTVAAWKAAYGAGAGTPISVDANGLLLKFTFVSDGSQHLQVNDGKAGAFTADFPAVGNVRDTDTVAGAAGTLPSDKILKSNITGSGAGNYNDDNLTPPNVAIGVAFGLSQTGQHACAGPPKKGLRLTGELLSGFDFNDIGP